MRPHIRIVVVALLLAGLLVFAGRHQVAGLVQSATFQVQSLGRGVTRSANVMVPMPDGVTLATDLYLPQGGPLAALLVRLPYGKDGFEGALWWVRRYTAQGYAVVVQDLRGRYGSGGVFTPYADAVSDGAATLDWIAQQPWSTGAVATAGCSALGEVQLIQSKSRNPHLRALIAEGAGGAIGSGGTGRGYFGIYEGGIPNLAAAHGWFAQAGGKTGDRMQPARVDPATVIRDLPSGTLVARSRDDPTDYADFMGRFDDTAYWDALGYLSGTDRFAAPALHVNSWHDIALRGTFEAAALMRANATTPAARDHQHVLIGPGLHCAFDAPFVTGRVGGLSVTPGSGLDYPALYDAWLDHWLRGGPPVALAQYTYFVMGANRWDQSPVWPPADVADVRWYLAPDALTPDVPPTDAAPYRYDPADPTPSIGGPICCTGGLDLPAGPLDQAANAARDDVLTFATPPLTDHLTLAGDVRVSVRMTSDAPDTDLVAVLLDIAPDGTMLAIQQGALRLRYRDGFDRPAPDMQPGVAVQATVTFAPIAYDIAAGHRIGLHLGSASFPRLECNLNTAGPNDRAHIPRIATNRILFGGPDASVLILPVQSDRHAGARRAD